MSPAPSSISRAGAENTLAWARIDLSDDLSEALIEEVQNDWYREVRSGFFAELVRSPHDGVAEFLDLAHVKPNTLGNTRMLLELG